MNEFERLMKRRDAILQEISAIEQMRRGSVTEQYVESVGKDGKTKRRTGPYFLYSFKEKKKTISRRVTVSDLVPAYRRQIQDFRRFKELVSELTAIGERISDLAVTGEKGVKRTKNSGSRKKPR